MDDLRGATVLLTGASRGLGPYLARALAGEGAHLVLTARSGDRLERVADEVRPLGVRALAVPADVTEPGGRARIVEAALDEFGAIDVLANNAGAENGGAYVDCPPDLIERIVQVNLVSAMLLTRAVLPHMLERGRGHIANMASMAGRSPLPYGTTYSATKHALVGFTLSLRAELRGTGVSASVVCPTFVEEAGMYEDLKHETGVVAPRSVGRTTPDEVATAFVDAIRSDRPEVAVGPRLNRVFQAVMAFSPRAGEALLNRSGIAEAGRTVAEARREAWRTSEVQDSRAST